MLLSWARILSTRRDLQHSYCPETFHTICFNAPTFFTVVWSWISRCAVLFSSALMSALCWLNLRFHLIRAPATRYASLMPALGQPSSLFLVSVSHRRQSATCVASGSSMCTFFFPSFVYYPELTFVSFPLSSARNNHRWPRTVAFVYPSPRSSSHTSRSQQQHQNNNRQSSLSNNRPKPTSNRALQPTTVTAVQPLFSEDLNKLSMIGRPHN